MRGELHFSWVALLSTAIYKSLALFSDVPRRAIEVGLLHTQNLCGQLLRHVALADLTEGKFTQFEVMDDSRGDEKRNLQEPAVRRPTCDRVRIAGQFRAKSKVRKVFFCNVKSSRLFP